MRLYLPAKFFIRKGEAVKSASPFFVLALPIFPVRLQTSIFGRSELNFRVRNGNGWTLALISTNCMLTTFVENIDTIITVFSQMSRSNFKKW